MICSKEICTGCFACYNSCLKNAIEMQEDELGYIYPNINKDKCINCNLCKKVCPALNEVKRNESIQAYAMWNKNLQLRGNSTSGGIATTLYKNVLNKGGVVYGCINRLDEQITFVRIEKIEDLHRIQGSKYVHSYINDKLKEIKKDLEQKRDVMFIGTPCQVAGLKKYLMKEYENLYTADIVCHGVPSQKLLEDEIKSNIEKCENIEVKFREKQDYCLKIYSNGKEIFKEGIEKNFYILGFLKSLFSRENCYNCKYANSKRVGDITLGDFWGLDKNGNNELYKKEEKRGISLCLINNEKGKKMFNEIKNDCYFEERTVEEAVNGNDQLRYPSIKNKETEKFKKLYKKYNYKVASKSCLRFEKLKKKILKG